jgi:hypothetical protein
LLKAAKSFLHGGTGGCCLLLAFGMKRNVFFVALVLVGCAKSDPNLTTPTQAPLPEHLTLGNPSGATADDAPATNRYSTVRRWVEA